MRLIQLYNNPNVSFNTFFAAVCGLVGGTISYSLTNLLMMGAILQAAFTALICGAAGVAGKELFSLCKRKFLAYRKKKYRR